MLCCGQVRAVNAKGEEVIEVPGGCSGCGRKTFHQLMENRVLRRPIYECVRSGKIAKWPLEDEIAIEASKSVKMSKLVAAEQQEDGEEGGEKGKGKDGEKVADENLERLKKQAEIWQNKREMGEKNGGQLQEEEEKKAKEWMMGGNPVILEEEGEDAINIIMDKESTDESEGGGGGGGGGGAADLHESSLSTIAVHLEGDNNYNNSNSGDSPVVLEKDNLQQKAIISEMNLSHICEVPDEDSPLTIAEKTVFDRVILGIGRKRLEGIPDDMIIRFVRGYATMEERDEIWIEKATSELEATIEWRLTNNVVSLRKQLHPRSSDFDVAWPSTVSGTDRKGHPLLVEKISELKIDRICGDFTEEELCMLQTQRIERLQHMKEVLSRVTSRAIGKHVYILDLSGIGLDILKAKQQVAAIFRVTETHYPETMYKTFLINTPLSFRAVWAVMSPLIHPDTKAKIQLIGGKYMKTLEAAGISVDQLPPSIGGRSANDLMGLYQRLDD